VCFNHRAADQRTEWHPRKVFTKLGVGSRRELPGVLANIGPGGGVSG